MKAMTADPNAQTTAAKKPWYAHVGAYAGVGNY